MAKKIVLFLVALAMVSVVSVVSAEIEKSPSSITGVCLFEGGMVYCPEINTPVTVAPRQAWEQLGDMSALPAYRSLFFSPHIGS